LLDRECGGAVDKEEPSVAECGPVEADNEVHPSEGEKEVPPQQEVAEDHREVMWFDANGVKLRAWTEADANRFTVVTSEGRFYYYYSVSTKNSAKRYQCRFCRRNANVEELKENGQKAWRFNGDFVSNHRQDTKCVQAAENPWSNVARKSAPSQPAQPPRHSADKPKKRHSSDAEPLLNRKQVRREESDASEQVAQPASKVVQHQAMAAAQAYHQGTNQDTHSLQNDPDDN
ncbi:hypothetical protein AAVH_43473, partial [Aphelenchoides avenae]